MKFFWGSYEKTIHSWLESSAKHSLIERLWKKDPTLWKKDAEAAKDIRARLGWLGAADVMAESIEDLKAFAQVVKGEGFRHVLLLGMGGSSLAPEVFQSVFGNAEGAPALLVLDSTDPERILDIEARLDLGKTLFIVSSKSGGTIELVSLYKYFFEKVKAVRGDAAGEQFIAITDPGSPLEELANNQKFKRVFLAQPDVGGRFSALTYFGLVPAALIGIDVSKILEGAQKMMASCRSAAFDNSALVLGVGMAVLAEEGRDKLTLVTSKGLESFGDWAEQLVAESTGKEELGVIPVVGESLGKPGVYGEDRFFVAILFESQDNSELEARLGVLESAGHPVLRFKIEGPFELGGEFFRWEMATAVACSLLKINAFDQPDVQAAKDRTGAILKEVESGRELSSKKSKLSAELFWKEIKPGDYVGILAFLPDREDLRKTLETLQLKIRSRTKNAVTLGIGPRYLHSTGQLHKGGPDSGAFLLITAAQSRDLAIPGNQFSFAQLELSQAMGDFEALEERGRRILHLRLPDLSEKSLEVLSAL